MGKILTISIAGYNVEKYIRNTLDSLLIDEIDLLEILVEDDGGTDSTADIVREYEERYPDSIHLIHKENGGYGSTINNSIKLATGKYFKQLDGDDWYDTENLSKLINEIKDIDVDVIYTPFIHYFDLDNSQMIVEKFKDIDEGIYNLNNVIGVVSSTLAMHNLAYRTSLLVENNINILENCFFTDTEYAYYPLIYSGNIFISHLPIYYYRIGREGQSVSIDGRRKHYKDHILVENHFIETSSILNVLEGNLKKYLTLFLVENLAAGLANFTFIQSPSLKNLQKFKERDLYIKSNAPDLYKKIYENSKFLKVLKGSHYLLYWPLYLAKMYQLKHDNMKKL